MTDNVQHEARRFLWRAGSFVLAPAGALIHAADEAPDARGALVAADSWLVDDGRVRAVELHRARFFDAAQAAGFANRIRLDAFFVAALDALPPVHRWFPRVELWAMPPGAAHRYELSLLVRLAPPPARTAVLRTLTGDDPRSIPSWKGPDLARLTALRDSARPDGIDDLVILSDDGAVVEGTSTALLWWRDGALHTPPASLARVDSVTARSITVLARATGVSVIEELATPSSLEGAEVWAVNALHGIRLVTAWPGGPTTLDASPTRSALWQRRLTALARPLV